MTGSITFHSKIEVPTGYLYCDGSTVSQTTYAGLFAVIGHTYGADPGGGNFILPDLKGKTVIGYDSTVTEFNALAKTGGAKTVDLSHSHTMTTHNHAFSSGSTSGGNSYTKDGNQNETLSSAGGHTHSVTGASVGNQTDATTNSQLSATQSILGKYITLYPLIKT